MAGVEHACGADPHGRLDRDPVRLGGLRSADRGRDDRHLVGTLERVVQSGRVGEVAGADTESASGERRRLVRVAHAHAHFVGGNTLEQLLVAAAARLLREGGTRAVTTRAVAQHAMADYVADKATRAADENGDPVADLRAAWHTHIAFGLANPDVFMRLLQPGRPSTTATGMDVLRARVARVAAAGLLKVSEARAVDMIHAAGSGAVLALLSRPGERGDTGLGDALLDATLGHIRTSVPAPPASDPTALAVAFRAALPKFPTLSDAERALLAEWLTRVVSELQR